MRTILQVATGVVVTVLATAAWAQQTAIPQRSPAADKSPTGAVAQTAQTTKQTQPAVLTIQLDAGFLKEAEAKFRRRLPMYYGQVVTEKQREEIYRIQHDYWPRIYALQKQLETLIAERDAKIEAVLSAEQKAKVQQLRDEAAKRRRSKSKAATQQDSTTSGG